MVWGQGAEGEPPRFQTINYADVTSAVIEDLQEKVSCLARIKTSLPYVTAPASPARVGLFMKDATSMFVL